MKRYEILLSVENFHWLYNVWTTGDEYVSIARDALRSSHDVGGGEIRVGSIVDLGQDNSVPVDSYQLIDHWTVE